MEWMRIFHNSHNLLLLSSVEQHHLVHSPLGEILLLVCGAVFNGDRGGDCRKTGLAVNPCTPLSKY